MTFKVTCYGPRGSLPSPSTGAFATVEYGGNTSCYYVEAGPFRLILDGGSGIRVLGNDLMKRREVGGLWLVFLSHYHWDHIQGLPFSVPLFIGANRFLFHGFTPSGHEAGPRPVVEHMLEHQQSNPHFPVAHSAMPSNKDYVDLPRQFSKVLRYQVESDRLGASVSPTTEEPGPDKPGVIKITSIPLNHPDGCLGYRIDYMGKVLVYATDNEPLRHLNAQLTKLGQGADWILLDGQYTEEQLAGPTQGFGHGTPRACVEQAKGCNAALCAIHHHDPNHDDAQVAQMEADALAYAASHGYSGTVEFAREGKVWTLL